MQNPLPMTNLRFTSDMRQSERRPRKSRPKNPTNRPFRRFSAGANESWGSIKNYFVLKGLLNVSRGLLTRGNRLRPHPGLCCKIALATFGKEGTGLPTDSCSFRKKQAREENPVSPDALSSPASAGGWLRHHRLRALYPLSCDRIFQRGARLRCRVADHALQGPFAGDLPVSKFGFWHRRADHRDASRDPAVDRPAHRRADRGRSWRCALQRRPVRSCDRATYFGICTARACHSVAASSR